jgi:SLOG in TRPM, prokaryote
MTTILTVRFGNGQAATAARVAGPGELTGALEQLGLEGSYPTLVLVGGAGRMDPADLERLRPVFEEALVPAAQAANAVVVDGGTDAGVMRLLGQAHARHGATFPLVGVAAAATVALDDNGSSRPDAAPLEPNHSCFLLVPGQDWGDESPWLARVATALAGTNPSVTVVVNGGPIVLSDVAHSVAAKRPVLLVAGSGRSADLLVDALQGREVDEQAARLAASGLLREVGPADQPAAIAAAVAGQLGS